MKINKFIKLGTCLSSFMLSLLPSLEAQLSQVSINPTNNPPANPGSYSGGVATFSITSDGAAFFPPSVTAANVDTQGDALTMAYESITGDFDRRVKITAISGDPADNWARGGLMFRTGTNSFNIAFELTAQNPQSANGGTVGFAGRALDGQNYRWWSRANYFGVSNAIPNQWLRLRRVGDYFSAYVGTSGTSWTLIGEHYQILPATLVVGPYAASSSPGLTVTVNFSSYGATPLSDTTPPALVSAGTLDKQVVGVKFSEAVSSSTAKVAANYQVTQGAGAAPVTISGVKMGISGDSVYLSVSGLTNSTFTVTVLGGVKDPSGNTIAANSSVSANALGWNHGDEGYIQNTTSRPTVGDDPGTVGQAVMVSSDENPEIEIVAGGSNAWNPGDFIHYVWRTAPLSGNFDVTVSLSRDDRAANYAGWGNSGIMLRAAFQNQGDNPFPTIETNLAATQVPMVALTTYQEGSGNTGGPDRGAIPLWRTSVHGGYGNGNAGFSGYNRVIGNVKGYYTGLNGVDASGHTDPQSVANSARYLRIKRVGTAYTFYASWDRSVWAVVDGPINLPDLPDQLLLGFMTMNDTGGSNPPFSGYGGNGHEIDPADPYNPANAGGVVQNESNYSVQRIKVYPNGVNDPLPVVLQEVDLRPLDELGYARPGSWTSTGFNSFTMTGGGTGHDQNLPAPADGNSGGDEISFAYETVTGDFDKQVCLTSLNNELLNIDGSPIDTNVVSVLPVDQWARAGLMLRTDTNSYNANFQLVAANPSGANVVRVEGRGLDAQNYTVYSRDYPGVTNTLPNQFLRMKRVGNSFTFFVSKDGVVWSMVCEKYQELPSTLLFGTFCAASVDPLDSVNNPYVLVSLAHASFTAYGNVNSLDFTPPLLISAGTIDRTNIGVKFNKQVSSTTATVPGNYKLSQGTVTAARVGIGGDAVYLTVSGLSSSTFTVTVTNVTDTSGNVIAANSSVNGKVTALTSTDIGSIQNPSPRTPTPGDDPYRVGQAIATSSDDAAEVEIVAGGSNAWTPGDFVHWLHRTTPITGDFDVAVKLSRNDRPNNTAGWANSGLMLRNSAYLAGQEYTATGTQVPMIANTTYLENSGPGRGAIPLWRNNPNDGYGNGNAGFGIGTIIGGIKGYYPDLRATDSAGDIDPESSPTEARWMRIQRSGANYTFYASWDGINWAVVDTSTTATITVPDPLYLGSSTMNDTGGGAPPFGGYANDGHSIIPNDPLGFVTAGGNVQNESNYSVQKVRIYDTASIGSVHIANTAGQIKITFAGTLVSAPTLSGPWTVVPMQSSPYTVTPSATKLFYRVLP